MTAVDWAPDGTDVQLIIADNDSVPIPGTAFGKIELDYGNPECAVIARRVRSGTGPGALPTEAEERGSFFPRHG